ncbi:YdeI/OmpD-associated family protein [Mucilaginibacter corticis]|nr:YdeI/OmpD-associated family protein [Mucilaginibacter corticis]
MKPGTRWLLFNAPDTYLASLEPLPDGLKISFNADDIFDGVQLFVKDTAELTTLLKLIIPVLKPDAVFWVIYPKKNKGVTTDLEMMSGWEVTKPYGLKPVASAAIDDVWTSLRFRPEENIKVSEGRNDNIRNNEFGEYIDVDNKQVKLPPEISDTLEKEITAMDFYQSLSYSNKKEYVLWILTAKQEKTRKERLVKMVEKLNDGKKNPSEK